MRGLHACWGQALMRPQRGAPPSPESARRPTCGSAIANWGLCWGACSLLWGGRNQVCCMAGLAKPRTARLTENWQAIHVVCGVACGAAGRGCPWIFLPPAARRHAPILQAGACTCARFVLPGVAGLPYCSAKSSSVWTNHARLERHSTAAHCCCIVGCWLPTPAARHVVSCCRACVMLDGSVMRGLLRLRAATALAAAALLQRAMPGA